MYIRFVALCATLIIFLAGITPGVLGTITPILSEILIGAHSLIAQDRQVRIEDNKITVMLDDDIGESIANFIIRTLSYAESHNLKEFRVIINSPGGSVHHGMRIKNSFDKSSIKIVCLVDGEAASMAFYILQGCHVRLMTSGSKLLAHKTRIRSNHTDILTANDLFRTALMLESIDEVLVQIMVANMSVSREFIESKIDNNDWIMGPEEALCAGAVDAIIQSIDELDVASYSSIRGLPAPSHCKIQ
jgi:ATP-dependent protease ClpP protease subunit